MGVAEQSGAGAAPETSVRCGAPIATKDIRAILETIADQKRRYQSVILTIEQADVFAALLRARAAMDDGYPLPIDQWGGDSTIVDMKPRHEILYEIGHFWVCRAVKFKGFEVYKTGITHSARVANIGFEGDDGFKRAKAEADRRARNDPFSDD